MAWNNPTQTQEKTTLDNQFLKFDALNSTGQTSEVKVRVLDEEPIHAWQHWVGQKPYNCPGINNCPVCDVRKRAKNQGRDVRNELPMNWRGFLNVLLKDTGEVKIFGFGTGMEKTLRAYYDKYGDLRNYDITIQKRKTGPQPINVEYALFYEGKSDLSNAERTAADAQRVDLAQFIEPASQDDLLQIAAGRTPQPPQENSSGLDEFQDPIWNRFQSAIAKHGLDVVSFGFTKTNRPADEVLEGIVNGLEKKG